MDASDRSDAIVAIINFETESKTLKLTLKWNFL